MREHYVQRCDVHALALYLFLLTVGDVQGLSYYADATLCRCLSMDELRLRQARSCLIGVGLIAYEAQNRRERSLRLQLSALQRMNREVHATGGFFTIKPWLSAVAAI